MKSQGKVFVSSDWHLADDPSLEYRWGIVEQFKRYAQRDDVVGLVIPGDITDLKDRHSAAFANRIADAFVEMAANNTQVVWVAGNHDSIDRACPFFRFLQHVPGITFVTKSQIVKVGRYCFYCIPNEGTWPNYSEIPETPPYDAVFCHETFRGSVAENMMALPGRAPKYGKMERWHCRVISGDVHVPQKIGNVTYVGAPHPVRFGDKFEPRIIMFENGMIKSIPHPTIRRLQLECTIGLAGKAEWDVSQVREGDHVSLRVEVPFALMDRWPEIKRRLAKRLAKLQTIVFDISVRVNDAPNPTEAPETPALDASADPFQIYCDENELPSSYVAVGRELL